jgi:hypothetical protein
MNVTSTQLAVPPMHSLDVMGRCSPTSESPPPAALLLYGEEHANAALADELALDGYSKPNTPSDYVSPSPSATTTSPTRSMNSSGYSPRARHESCTGSCSGRHREVGDVCPRDRHGSQRTQTVLKQRQPGADNDPI